jgi:hypothetical protein
MRKLNFVLNDIRLWHFVQLSLVLSLVLSLYTKVDKRHGQLEKRTLESSRALGVCMQEYLNWPGGEQVMSRNCQRTISQVDRSAKKSSMKPQA